MNMLLTWPYPHISDFSCYLNDISHAKETLSDGLQQDNKDSTAVSWAIDLF